MRLFFLLLLFFFTHLLNASDWKVNTGAAPFGVAVDSERDKIYFGAADSHLYCVNNKGCLEWKRHVKTGPYKIAVDSKTGNVFCRGQNCTKYLCFNTKGELIQEFDTENMHGCDIDYYSNRVYVISTSHPVTNEHPGYLYCFTTEGEFLWKYKVSKTPGWGLAVDPIRGCIYITTNGNKLIALKYDGEKQWERDLSVSEAIKVDLSIGRIFCGSRDGSIYCFDANGHECWRYKVGAIITGLDLDESRSQLYFAAEDGYLYCFHVCGWFLGRYEIKGSRWRDVAVHPKTGQVYCGSIDGYLYCIPPYSVDHSPAVDQDLARWEKENASLKQRVKLLEEIIGVPCEVPEN
ncbi:MAG: PQQ-binding-like beta-propeller repeat protein [Chlamydiota bacterium]